MPNRILRDWTDSLRVNAVSPGAELFFVRLIMKADDFGRFHAIPSLLKASLFPLRLDATREADISRWTAECAKAGLIVLYVAGNRSYLEIMGYGQRVKDGQKSKFPDNPGLAGKIPDVPALVGVGDEGAIRGSESKAESFVREPAAPGDVVWPEQLDSVKFRKAWSEYESYRKRAKHKPLLPESQTAQLKNLATYGEDIAIIAINNTIANQWQGIFPEKVRTNGHPNKNSAHARTADDRDADRTGFKPAHIPTKLLP